MLLVWLQGGGVVAKTLTADPGSYDLTGADATLKHGWRIAAGDEVATDDLLLETSDHLLLETGDFLLIEENVIVGGVYALTGTDVSLNKGQRITADAGSYALTGTDATGVHRFILNATVSASYALTGSDVGTYYGRKVDATTAGSYSLTGTDASLRRNLPIVAEAGTYTLTGTDATLTKTAAAAFSLAADGGSYALTGTDPAVLHTWRIAAGDETAAGDLLLETSDHLLLETGDFLFMEGSTIVGGVYALTGTDVALSTGANKQISAEVGSYALLGTDVTLTPGIPNRVIVADAGSYALTGTTAFTTHGWRITAGDVVETPLLDELGNPLLDELGNPLYAEEIVGGVYTLAGTDVTLTKTTVGAYTITADSGSYLLTGSPVTLTSSAQPAIILPTRGEWPEKTRRRRREYERTARETLRASLDRLFDGGEYDPPPEVFEQAIAAAEVVQLLPGLPLADLQAVTDLIARIQEMVRQRLLDEAQVEAATQMARQHLIDSIAIADQVYRRTRQNYLIKTLLLIAE